MRFAFERRKINKVIRWLELLYEIDINILLSECRYKIVCYNMKISDAEELTPTPKCTLLCYNSLATRCASEWKIYIKN